MSESLTQHEIKSNFKKEKTLKEILKDLISELNLYKKIFKKYILLFLVITALGGLSGYYIAYKSEPSYRANMKFVLKSEGNSGTSSLNNLSAILGVGGGGGASSMERIIELISSERIIGNALLTSETINNKKELLINHFIELENYRGKWKNDTILQNVKFSKGDNFETLSYSQRKAIKIVTNKILGGSDLIGSIITKNFNKKSGIVSLTAEYKSESFTIGITKAIYNELINFYVDQTIYTTTNNVEILSKKVDSIKTELLKTQNSFAKNTDQSLGLLLQKDKVESKSLAIKEQLLIIMYGEAQKNLETVKFMRESTVPAFAIIDEPYSPIEPIVKSKNKYILTGILFAFILVLLSIRLRMAYLKML